MKGDGAMGHQDARMREYDRMTCEGLSPMTSCEIVEEAKDTIKINQTKTDLLFIFLVSLLIILIS